jgi:hypothetical protein
MASSPVLGRLATVTVLTSTFTIIPIQSLICVKSLETIKATLLEIAASLCDSRTKRHAVPPNDLLEVLSKEQQLPLNRPRSRHLFILLTADRVISRASLMGIAGLLATVVPNFGLCIALIGAVTTMLISLIAPALLWVAVQHSLQDLRSWHIVLSVLLVCLGLVGMAVGLRGALESLSGSGDD